MTLIGGLLIVGQLVLVAAFVGGLAFLVGLFIYDAVDNRRREAKTSDAPVIEPAPSLVSAPSTSAVDQLIA